MTIPTLKNIDVRSILKYFNKDGFEFGAYKIGDLTMEWQAGTYEWDTLMFLSGKCVAKNGEWMEDVPNEIRQYIIDVIIKDKEGRELSIQERDEAKKEKRKSFFEEFIKNNNL